MSTNDAEARRAALARFYSRDVQAVLRAQLPQGIAAPNMCTHETLDQFGWAGIPAPRVIPLLPSSTGATFGNLQVLPADILTTIVNNLEPRQIVEFRKVCRRARSTVGGNLLWIRLRFNAVGVLRAAITLNVRGPSLLDYSAALYSTSCCHCGLFGELMYLPRAMRVCWSCLISQESFWPVTQVRAMLVTGRDWDDVENMPCIRTLRGRWGPYQRRSRFTQVIVDGQAAADNRTDRADSAEDREFVETREWMRIVYLWGTVITAPVLTPLGPGTFQGHYCGLCWQRSENIPGNSPEAERRRMEMWHRSHDPRTFIQHMWLEHRRVFWRRTIALFPWATILEQHDV